MSIEIQLKRGTASYLDQLNPVLSAGEPCLETDTLRVKYGDGASPWRQLPYTGTTQQDDYVFSGTTTTTTPLTLVGDRTISLQNDELVHFDALITGQQVARYTPTATWRIRGSAYRRTDGVVSFVGTPVTTVSGSVGSGQTAAIILNSAINGISVRVSGVASKTVVWSAQLSLKKLDMTPFAYTPVGGCLDPDADNYNAAADFDNNSCMYPGPPATPGIVLVETNVAEITSLDVLSGTNPLVPAFDPAIHDYYVRSSVTYGAAAAYSVTVNGGEFTTSGYTAAAYTLQITDGTNYYYVRVLPSDMQVGVVNYGPEPDYVPGYYLCVNTSQQVFPNNYWIIMDHYGVPLWYARDGESLGSLHLGADLNRVIFSRNYQTRTVGRINGASLSVRDVEFVSSPTYGSSFDWDTHDSLELNLPVERKYNIFAHSYTNGFYLQEQSADGTLVWEWASIDYFDSNDPEFFHVNSIDVHPVTGNVLVSARHTNSIMCIDYSTKEVLWAIDSLGQLQDVARPGKLANTKWLTIQDEPTGYAGVFHSHDARWHHNIAPLVEGNYVISAYDNQTDNGNNARGVIYEINPVVGTAKHRSSIIADLDSPYICNYAVVDDGAVPGEYSHAVYNVLGASGNSSALTAQVDEYRGTVDGAKTKVFALGMLNPPPLNQIQIPNYRVIKVKPDNFRLDNLRAMCGVKIDGTWPAPPTPPPPAEITSAPAALLLNFNAANNSTTFVDSSVVNRQITRYGAAVISTAQSKFGGSSLYMPAPSTPTGTQNGLSIPITYAWGANDWTIEFWLRPGSTSTYQTIFTIGDIGQPGSLNCHLYFNNMLYFNSSEGGGNEVGGMVVDQWTHIALVRKNGSVALFKDGVKSGPEPSQTFLPATTMTIGYAMWSGYGPSFTGYIDDFRIFTGVALYSTDFTPPTQQLENKIKPPAGVLLNFNGSNNSTTFTDSSVYNRAVSRAGSQAVVSTAQSKFGGSSGYFVGNVFAPGADGLNIPIEYDFAANNWTIDFWLRPATDNAYRTVFSIAGGANGRILHCHLYFSGSMHVNDGNSGATNGGSLAANTWTHVAITRKSGVITLYHNGVYVDSNQQSPGSGTSSTITLGYANYGANSNSYTGYIDDFRVVPGVCLYDGAFTPPTQQAENRAGSAADLLLNFNNTANTGYPNYANIVNDLGFFANAITLNGAVTPSSAQSKFGGASAQFDGSTGYLSLPYNAALVFNSAATFTIEAWVRPAATQTGDGSGNAGAIVSMRTGTGFTPYEFSIRTDLKLQLLAATTPTGPWATPTPVTNTALTANQWNHVALVSNAGNVTVYINGVADTSFVNKTIAFVSSPTGPIYIGRGGGGYFNGFIDDLRITKGFALYTGNFTPPTAQLT